MNRFLLYSKWKFALLLFLKLIQSALLVGFALLLQYIVNLLNEGTDMRTFFLSSLFMLIYMGFFAIILYAKDFLTASYINEASNRLRNALSKKLLNLQYEEFTQHDSAKYISNLTNDMKLVTTNYFNSILVIPEEIFTFLLAVAVSFYIHYIVALAMLGLTLLIFIVPLIFNRPMNKANLALSKSMKEFTHILKQTFLGIDVVKNFGSEQTVQRSIARISEDLTKKSTRIDRLNFFSQNTGMMIVVLLQIGSIAVAGWLMLEDILSIGALIAVVQLGNHLFMPIMNVSGKLTMIGGIKDLNNTFLAVLRKKESGQGADLQFEQCIALNNVHYRYNEEERYVLKNITLQFQRGGKYLIVGRSGSGKSTILKLIAKMYSHYEGTIRFDDAELSSVSEQSLNKHLAFAQQRSYVFNMSVQENIDFNGTHDQAQLDKAIELACLDSFVDTLEDGLDTVIDEEVNQISGGEKLRIGLARALYKDTDILLLDEVTSALDKDTAYRVEKNLLALHGKTVLNVSHKINEDLLALYHKIAIIEDGTLILFDSPDAVTASPSFQKYLTAAYEDEPKEIL